MLELKRYHNLYILCSVLGMVTFLIIYGFKILNPLNINWILGGGGDLTQHYIGWKAFRYSKWQFPFGCTDNLAYPFQTSIIFTDSIPLLAIIFKIFSPILPKEFQYFGIYGLLCYVLQAFFSAVLLKKYIKQKIGIIISSMFFVLSPVMLARMYYHTALASHFLLLLTALGIVYYEETFCKIMNAIKLSMLTSFLAASIHIYLLAMCGLIWIAYCLFDILKTKKYTHSIIIVSVFFLISSGTIWLLGGFNGVFKAGRGGLGNYGMNLNAFYNSYGNSTILEGIRLPDIDISEGYAYLGVGILLLLVISVWKVLYYRKYLLKEIKKSFRKILAMATIGIFSYVYAVFPCVYLNDKMLFRIQLPIVLDEIFSIFRATGRFSWLVYYLIVGFIVTVFLIKKEKTYYLEIVMAIALAVQIYDITPLIQAKKEYLEVRECKNCELTDSAWEHIIEKNIVCHVYFASNDMKNSDLFIVTNWALSHNLTVNKFYFARSLDKQKVADLLGDAMWEKNMDSIFIFNMNDKEACEKNGLSYIITKDKLILAGKAIEEKRGIQDDTGISTNTWKKREGKCNRMS